MIGFYEVFAIVVINNVSLSIVILLNAIDECIEL